MRLSPSLQRLLSALMLAVNVALIGAVSYLVWSYVGRPNPFVAPCSKPITYSLGRFDTQFGISRKDFLDAVDRASKIWEAPINKDLFAYAPTGGEVTINLIYDYRQQATQKLQKLGIVVSDDRSAYDALKVKYDAQKNAYLSQKAAVDAEVAAFEVRKRAYEREVAAANARGGASRQEYQQLQQERDAINALAAKINADTAKLNQTIDTLNAMGTELNRLISVLNLSVANYNTVGQSAGSEFEEGLYTSDASGRRIDIYQFDSKAKLIRVLAHELGHAIGLQHVDDPAAIMYRLNIGKNEKLTATDVVQLRKKCGLSP